MIPFIVYLCICILPVDQTIHSHDTGMYNRLEREMRNWECCQKKMRCCRALKTTPEIELRAVMTRCPNIPNEDSLLTRRMKTSQFFKENIQHFQGFETDEPLVSSQLFKCQKKVIITLRIKNEGFLSNKSQYVVVDHVFDPKTQKKGRLLNPYVVKLNQDPLKQLYPMSLVHVVNAEAKEQVINKRKSRYYGCDFTSKHSTCGSISYQGRIVPFSQGFCCSCDPLKNEMWQKSDAGKFKPPLIVYSDPAYLLDGVECPRSMKISEDGDENGNIHTENGNSARNAKGNPTNNDKYSYRRESVNFIPTKLNEKYIKSLNDYTEMHSTTERDEALTYAPAQEIEDVVMNSLRADSSGIDEHLENKLNNLETFITNFRNKERREKRQFVGGIQIRGGQDCSDRYVPPWANPKTYHDSAHCLRFSDLWYSAYNFHEPKVEHKLRIQVFEKQESVDGKTEWNDLTQGKPIFLGTYKEKNRQNFRNIVAVDYFVMENFKINPTKMALNYKAVILLIPEGVKRGDKRKHPEVANGPGEYLLIHPSQITTSGDRCNVAGVGFEAFFKQPNRCMVQKGTCLANQPSHLWQHDHEAEKKGKKGCFFLKHYGEFEGNPIVKSDSDLFLRLNYIGDHYSSLELEVRADFNTVIRSSPPAVITEVYIESTNPKKTLITVKVTNSGLVSDKFFVKLGDCPRDLPSSLNSVKSTVVVIPPQKQHIFYLKIQCVFPADRFHCSVEVLNSKNELLALRRVRFQKNDRCVCTWHCLCVCMNSGEGLQCLPMSVSHYHAAGFLGSLPIDSVVVEYSALDGILSALFYLSAFLLLTMLVLGISKALIGLFCCPAIGIWGLDVLMDPKQITCYYEKKLRGRKVVYDECGWPVHPDTGRKVRSVSPATEFCFNVLFFLTYPPLIILLVFKRLCWPYYTSDFTSAPASSKSSKKSKSTCDKCIYKNDTDTVLCQAMTSHFDKINIKRRNLVCESTSSSET